MGVEICTRCDTHVDLDYNTEGHYFEDEKDGKYTCEYVCGLCLTDAEIDKFKERGNES